MLLGGPHLQYKGIWSLIFNFGGRPPQVKFFLTLISKNLENKIFPKNFADVDTEGFFNLCKF